MGVIMDILKDVPLFDPSIKEQILKTEVEFDALKASDIALKDENANLITILQKIENGEAIHKYVCPKCKQPRIKPCGVSPTFFLRQFGNETEHYECKNCGHKYDIRC